MLFYPTLYEGFEYSRHCIYTGAAPNQNSLQLAKFLLSTYGNRFLLVGSNYIYPYESNRVMGDFVIQGKGKVLDEIYVPLYPAAAGFRKGDRADQEDVPGCDLLDRGRQGHGDVLRRLSSAGFDPARMPIASLTTSEAEVAEMGREAAEGHITAAPFFETSSSASARRFVASFKRKYGADAPVPAAPKPPIFSFIWRCGRSPDAGPTIRSRVLKDLRDSEFDAPQGRVRIDPENNHTYLWPRIARLDRYGRFQTVWNPGVRVKPDPYCVVQSLDDWSVDDLPTFIHKHLATENRRWPSKFFVICAACGFRSCIRRTPSAPSSSSISAASDAWSKRSGRCPNAGRRLRCRAARHRARCARRNSAVAEVLTGRRPTLIAVVSYEDPSTLQLVLEAGAVAVIERPIRPFGLLTNLTIARSIWLERREAEKRMRKLERKLAGIQRIQKAKVILMDGQGLNEAEAYESIRRQAMSKRLSMDDMAAAIIHANELLQYRPKGD